MTGDIEYKIELDQLDAVKSAQDLAKYIASLTQNVQSLQTALNNTFSSQAFDNYAKRVSKLQPGTDFRAVGRTAGVLASGGPQTTYSNAALKGIISTIKTDPAYQLVQVEKEANKVAEARLALYRRLRQELPETADIKQVQVAWQNLLKSISPVPDNVTARRAYDKWNRDTLAEAVKLEKQITVEQNIEVVKRLEAEQALYDRYAKKAAAKLSYIEDPNRRQAQTQDVLNRLNNFGAKRGFQPDNDRLSGVIADEVSARRSFIVPEVDRNAPEERQKAASGRVQAAQDFLGHNGGASVLGLQAQYTANSFALNGILSSLTFATSQLTTFQAGLKDLQAITGATNIEMGSLSKTIVDVGTNSKFSLTDITEGAKILAQAGYSASQIQQTLKPILNYAVATGTDVAGAVDTVTSVLAQFDLSLERTGEVTNIMTAGLNKTKLNSEQLALGIQYAGNQASLSNVKFEEMVAALGAMANAGIRSGSTLGTGLRSILAEFDAPSKKFKEQLKSIGLSEEDVSLKTHSLSEVMHTLTEKGFTYSQAVGSFNIRAAAAFSALQNNLTSLDTIGQQIVNTNAATTASATQMDTFNAQWERFKNVMTGILADSAGPILKLLQGLIGGFASLLSGLRPIAPLLGVIITGFTSLAAAATLTWIGALLQGLFNTTAVLKAFGLSELAATAGAEGLGVASLFTAASLRAIGVALIGNPLFVIAGVISIAVAAFTAFNYVAEQSKRRIEEFAAKANEAGAEAEKYGQRVSELDKTITLLVDRHAALSANTKDAAKEAESAQAKFKSWGLQLNSNVGDVNELINSLVNLKSKMAEVQLQKLRDKDYDLGQQEKEYGKDSQGRQQSLTLGIDFANKSSISKKDAALQSAFQAAKSGKLEDLSRLRDLLSQDKYKSNTAILRLIPNLDDLIQSKTGLEDVETQRAQIKDLTVTPRVKAQSADLSAYVYRSLGNDKDEDAQISKEKDPRKQAQLQADAEAKRAARVTGFRQQASDRASQLGLSPEDYLNSLQEGDQNVSAFLANGNDFSSLSSTSLSQKSELYSIRAKKAKKLGNTSEANRYLALVQSIGVQQLKNRNPELSGQDALDAFDISDQLGQAKLDGTGSANKGKGKLYTAKAKALETLIENAALNLGPTPDDMLAGTDKLTSLLAQWKSAKESEVRATTEPADLKERLADLKVEEEQFTTKILQGNVSAAKALIAKAAQLNAANAGTTAINDIKINGASLPDALQSVQDKINASIAAQIAVVNAEVAKTPGVDPATAHEAADKIADIRRQGIDNIIKTSIDVTKAFFDEAYRKVALEAQAKNQIIDRHDASLDAFSNLSGQINGSDVQRTLADRQKAHNATIKATNNRDEAHANVDLAQDNVDKAKAMLELAKGSEQATNDAKANLVTANNALQQMQASLAKADDDYTSIVTQAPTFATASEAISKAWQAFSINANLAKPVLSQLADGMVDVFGSVQGSMTKFVSDVLSGTATIQDAFASMAKSILQSILDMVAKMIANQALIWILQAFGYAPDKDTGGFQKIAPPAAKAQGGLIRMAGGGGIPGRDSVNILGMPGEYIMRQSAVSMIGADNLDRMNAMGNRRISEVPPISSALPQRQPDTSNVYIMAPNQKPTLGKNDVIAIISEDMLQGGQTKRLVKSIQLGVA